jgi:hypothetical protein
MTSKYQCLCEILTRDMNELRVAYGSIAFQLAEYSKASSGTIQGHPQHRTRSVSVGKRWLNRLWKSMHRKELEHQATGVLALEAQMHLLQLSCYLFLCEAWA